MARYRSILVTIALCVIVAASPLLFTQIESILPGVTQQNPSLVVDPASVQPEPASSLAVLGLSGQIMDLSTAGKYRNASQLLALAHSISGNLDADLATYLNLLTEANDHLNLTIAYLNQTSTLVEAGNLTSALAELNLANDQLAQTKSTLDTVNLVLSRISDLYDVDVTSQHRKVAGLTSLMKTYQKEAGNLQSRILSADKREPTVLQLRALESSILVNQSLVLVGSLLDANGTPLPSREIQILLIGTSVNASTTTSENGTFSSTLRITPNLNLSIATFTGQFEPIGHDQATYRSSVSPFVAVEVVYLEANLVVSSPSAKARVLDPFAIQGTLLDSNNSPLQGRMVDLSIDNATVAELITDAGGNFSFEYSFDPGTIAGVHIIGVAFVPENDLFAMQTETFPIQVFYYPTSLSANLPAGPVFSGQTIVVTGIITSPNANENGTVQAFANGQPLSTIQVDSGGKFVLPVTVPLEASSDVVITLAFLPITPWLQGSTETLQLPVTNSVAIALACAAMSLVGLAVYKTPRSLLTPVATILRRPKRGKEEEKDLTESRTEENPTKSGTLVLDLSALRSNAASPTQLVKSVYRTVRGLLSLAFTVPSEHALTHWEFLEKTRLLLKEASKYLEQLTISFESVEYAEQRISTAEAEKAVNNSIVLTENVGGKVLT